MTSTTITRPDLGTFTTPFVSLGLDDRKVILMAASAVLLCRFAISLALIPPWQQPDEHAHVAFMEVARSRLTGITSSDPGREAEILLSMREYDWWRHYARGAPDTPLPTRFAHVGTIGDTIGINPTLNVWGMYYAMIAAALVAAPQTSVVGDLYLMRIVSAMLGLLTLWVAWRGAREGFGEEGGAMVAALLALHPQFAIVSTTASPDALVNLLGACVWWLAVLAVRNGNFLRPLGVMWAAAICAAMVDRMAIPLVACAFVASVVALARRWLAIVVTAICAAVFGASLSLSLVDVLTDAFGSGGWERVMPPPEARTWHFVAQFTLSLFESWWSSLGWTRYSPPSWWIAITFVLSATAAAGVLRRIVRHDDRHTGTVLWLAIMMMAVQTAAVYWVYFKIAHGPQGRHLFPVLVPALVLLWIGIEAFVPRQYRRYAAIGLVVTLALLDAAVWVFVAVPAYAS